jgi:hypothetical protein
MRIKTGIKSQEKIWKSCKKYTKLYNTFQWFGVHLCKLMIQFQSKEKWKQTKTISKFSQMKTC